MTDTTTTDTRSLSSQLVALTKDWGQHTLVPDDKKNRAVEIGKALFEAGGKPKMVEAYYSAKARNRYAAVLQHYWDGIGDWIA